jgi:uroporphyrinogen-III synthase
MKKVLYLGTSPKNFATKDHLIHYPVINIVPRSIDTPEIERAFEDIPRYSHLIFTGKNTVEIFFNHFRDLKRDSRELKEKCLIAIGQVTASYLKDQGQKVDLISQKETQEGLIDELISRKLEQAYVFLPRSSRSRPLLVNFFEEHQIKYRACDLYDTLFQSPQPVPDLSEIDEIVFTSPSTIDAFLQIYSAIPKGKKLTVLGPVTAKALKRYL